MKTKLTIAMGVMAAALFLVVPNASPRHTGGGGGGAGLAFSGSCAGYATNDSDTSFCSVTALVPAGDYTLNVTDNCSNLVYTTGETVVGTGGFTFNGNISEEEPANCAAVTAFTFELLTRGKRGGAVAAGPSSFTAN